MKTSSGHSSTLLTNRIPTNDHDQSKQDNKSRNTEWVASALRVCGKWSEQLSSKGKVYYYNCETYTSQWQKPVDWNLPDLTQSELHRVISDRQGGTQGNKRPYSVISQSDRLKSRPQDDTSPKRAKTATVAKNNIDRSKGENLSLQRPDLHNSHRSTPKNNEHTSHGSVQRLLTNAKDSIEMESLSSTCAVSCRESTNIRDCGTSLPSSQNKIPHNSAHHDIDRIDCHSPRLRVVAPSKLANQSPLATNAAPSGHPVNSDQKFTSRTSSPFPPQQHGLPNDKPVLSNGFSLLPDPHLKDANALNTKERHPSVSDRQSSSPYRTNPLKPDQVLRNLVPVLSYVIASSNNNRTPHVNSNNSRSQPSVVNLISSILESHKKMADGRSASHTSSPASNRTSSNGSDRVKSDRTPGCPTSSSDGGASVISPCPPRSSPSPQITSTAASDFLNHPQKSSRLSPVLEDPATLSLSNSHSAEADFERSSESEEGSGASELTKQSDSAEHQSKSHSCIPLDTPEMLRFVDSRLSAQFQHTVADTLETEAQALKCTFDRLHGVLYSELVCEMKKLRALLSISDSKMRNNQRKREGLQELMNSSEPRRFLPRLSSPDQPI
nr:WW domain containing protein [Hymenolepis microstoma]